jgi:hypothetical protein
MEVGSRMNGGTWSAHRIERHEGTCTLKRILEPFIINHLTTIEEPFGGMMVKIYRSLKLSIELHWPRAVRNGECVDCEPQVETGEVYKF